jgi:GxxExxY protein
MPGDYGYNGGRNDQGYNRGGDRGGYNRGGGRGGYNRGGRPGGGGHHRDYDGGGHHRRGVQLDELDPALTELSRRVIGCAIEVHKDLGPGYPWEVYFKSLQIELKAEEIAFKPNEKFEVEFDGEVVGEVVCDLFIGERFLVKLMAEHTDIGTQPRSELRAQLRAADFELGLIINFGERRLKDGLVRVLNPDKLRELRGEVDEDEYEYEDEDETHREGVRASPPRRPPTPGRTGTTRSEHATRRHHRDGLGHPARARPRVGLDPHAARATAPWARSPATTPRRSRPASPPR